MAQFILETGTVETHKLYDRLPEIAQGFLDAACFTGVVTADDDGCVIDEVQPSLDQFYPEALAGLIGEAIRFAKANAELLTEACQHDGYDMVRAGSDLWFSMNGHGTGFWDRDLGDVGDKLHELCRNQSIDLFADDDGRINLAMPLAPFDPADLLPEQVADVGGAYGAAMGRATYRAEAGEPLSVRRVTLDEGGYDAGGAYWGIGQSLWCVMGADDAPLAYIRAATGDAALVEYRK